jgi:hypothetical protein
MIAAMIDENGIRRVFDLRGYARYCLETQSVKEIPESKGNRKHHFERMAGAVQRNKEICLQR